MNSNNTQVSSDEVVKVTEITSTTSSAADVIIKAELAAKSFYEKNIVVSDGAGWLEVTAEERTRWRAMEADCRQCEETMRMPIMTDVLVAGYTFKRGAEIAVIASYSRRLFEELRYSTAKLANEAKGLPSPSADNESDVLAASEQIADPLDAFAITGEKPSGL